MFEQSQGYLLLVNLICLVIWFFNVRPVWASQDLSWFQASGQYDVIAAINDLRAANGLPAYQVNDALMAAAQAHSEYQASINKLTHMGADSSNPKQRAVLAGYGGGKTVFVSENIAMGLNLSAQGAVIIWQGDNLHLSTMLSASYQDVGVGIAMSGNIAYYTLDAGNVLGSVPARTPSNATQATLGDPPLTATLSQPGIMQPIVVATPLPDGSIVHIVEPGQFPILIAQQYGITLEELLQLNGLTEQSVIYPGDRLLICPPQLNPIETPTEVTQTVPVQLTQTRIPTFIPSPSPTRTADLSITPADEQPGAADSSESLVDPLLLAVVILVVVGLAFVLIGNLMKRKS
jgi:LysM repeat protein